MGNSENTDESKLTKKKKGEVPMRTCLLMILAGVYVAYLGVSLCINVIKGVEDSNPGFMVAGIVFVVLGVGFVINGIRGSLKISKAQKEQETIQSMQPESEEKDAASDIADFGREASTGKKLSIAERANLVSRLGDDQEDGKEA